MGWLEYKESEGRKRRFPCYRDEAWWSCGDRMMGVIDRLRYLFAC